jgi:hypothetical protein
MFVTADNLGNNISGTQKRYSGLQLIVNNENPALEVFSYDREIQCLKQIDDTQH